MSIPAATLPAAALPVKERGSKAFLEGHYALSINEYTNAIKIAPKYAPLYSQRAAAYMRLNQLPKALQDARVATDIDERWAKGWMRLGEVMQAIGETETDPTGLKLLYGAVEETYENACDLLQLESSNGGKQFEEAEKQLKEVREKLASL
ncbi:hypothetical protein BDZ94DRAFT_1268719 [Collybia nuda]|uniref:Uncharacterized protein n=1 Tax=Collybia nuda TaxID=64659 RepID=A0A9P5XYY8_9AGAR|nr:hypothetical protein BDZ94DRAFT_1268719 [Collybia nuda]